MNIVGNVNGSYQTPKIDLFEIAKQRGNQSPTTKSSGITKQDIAAKISISPDALRALHGSKLSGSIDMRKQVEDMQYVSEHQSVESFSSRFSRSLHESYNGVSYEDRPTIEEKGENVLETLKTIADEIANGYTNGNRIRFVEDNASPDGYRKLTKQDELSLLQDDFEKFIEERFGKKHQEESLDVISALNDFQKIKEETGIGKTRVYKAEGISSDFVQNLIVSGRQYITDLLK